MSIADLSNPRPVTSTKTLASNPIFELREEKIDFDGETLTRSWVKHLSAVAVVPVDAEGRVLMIRQYRHPVRSELWEIPAGLLDAENESLLAAAQRELFEEADLQASTWSTLVDFYVTPGMSDEGVRIYLAEDLQVVPEDQRHQREAEEARLVTAWVPLQEAVDAILAGKVHNGPAVVGILGLNAQRSSGLTPRSTDSAWENHPRGYTV